MAEPLKNAFGRARVERIATEFQQAWPAFPADRFLAVTLDGFEGLELMDRIRRVADGLVRTLPPDYREALAIVLRTLGPPLQGGEGHGMEAFHYAPHTFFVAAAGLRNPEASLDAIHDLTSRSSCEFAIRPFLLEHPDLTLRRLDLWTRDHDEHVRRLVSEGTRPRLPWAPRLPAFQRDPAPCLALLEKLRDDPSPYVRRSVANHLNDISKDHPGIALKTCKRWLRGASPERRRLVHHALRGLVRQGSPEAIALLGGDASDRLAATVKLTPKRVAIGGAVEVQVTVRNDGDAAARAILALRVHFVNARGGTSPKTFRLRTLEVAPEEEREVRHTLSLAQMTTRTHHRGVHRVELLVNGVAQPVGEFRVT